MNATSAAIEAFFASEGLDPKEFLHREIVRDSKMFVWRVIPRKNSAPQLSLMQQHGATERDVCTIVPQKHHISQREYFEVSSREPNRALEERGATFEKLSVAIAWCSANDWLAEYKAPTSSANGHTAVVAAASAFNEAPMPPQTSPGATFAPQPTKPGDAVNHPPHYNMGRYEVIDVLVDWGLGALEFNIVKYVARAHFKGNRLEDLKKARFYLNYLIEQLEGEKS